MQSHSCPRRYAHCMLCSGVTALCCASAFCVAGHLGVGHAEEPPEHRNVPEYRMAHFQPVALTPGRKGQIGIVGLILFEAAIKNAAQVIVPTRETGRQPSRRALADHGPHGILGLRQVVIEFGGGHAAAAGQQRQDFAGHGVAIFADDPVRDRIGRSPVGPAAQPRRKHVVLAVAWVGPLRDEAQHQLVPSLQKQSAVIALDAHRRGLVDRFGSIERIGDLSGARAELVGAVAYGRRVGLGQDALVRGDEVTGRRIDDLQIRDRGVETAPIVDACGVGQSRRDRAAVCPTRKLPGQCPADPAVRVGDDEVDRGYARRARDADRFGHVIGCEQIQVQ